MLSIGNGDGIGINIAADNIAYLTQGLAIDVAKQGERFVSDVERQFRLTRGAGLLLPFNALHQQNDKTDAYAAKDHRNTDF